MAKFRNKPVVIEAEQWFENGDHPEVGYFRRPEPEYSGNTIHEPCDRTWHNHGWIDTLEGGHTACPGDWIITGVQGEFYPCKPDIFESTYEPVEEDYNNHEPLT